MGKRIPKRVKIDGNWLDVREGWAGTLEMSAYMTEKYTAREPYVHISDLYFVYDANGSKVGEFNTRDPITVYSYSGRVTGFDM